MLDALGRGHPRRDRSFGKARCQGRGGRAASGTSSFRQQICLCIHSLEQEGSEVGAGVHQGTPQPPPPLSSHPQTPIPLPVPQLDHSTPQKCSTLESLLWHSPQEGGRGQLASQGAGEAHQPQCRGYRASSCAPGWSCQSSFLKVSSGMSVRKG